MNLASLWSLDPAVTYLNHGSFGACPIAVLALQTSLRQELEREPVDFLVDKFPVLLEAARANLALFLGASPADLAFVPNATAGVNAVLRSLPFQPGDEILVTTHTYAACRNVVQFIAARSGARVVTAELPFPCPSDDAVVDAVMAVVTERTRVALLDHVTSPTALVLPIERLVATLTAQGIDTLVDGAHAPGMLPLQLSALGAAYYTGNAHKWLCAPKGAAFLHVRGDRQQALHPNVISHGFDQGFHAEFDWTGTFDPTPWLCIPKALQFIGGLLPQGWPQVMSTNRGLALAARALVLNALALDEPCPASMIGSIASIPLPVPKPGSPAESLDARGLHDWFRVRGLETWVHAQPLPLLRISAQLYNDIGQFERLAVLLGQALHG